MFLSVNFWEITFFIAALASSEFLPTPLFFFLLCPVPLVDCSGEDALVSLPKFFCEKIHSSRVD